MRGRMCVVSLGADDPQKLSGFYATVFEQIWGRNLTEDHTSYSTWISAGVKFNINQRHDPAEKCLVHIAVEDIGATSKAVTDNGGQILWGPADIAVSPSVLEDFRNNYPKVTNQPAAAVTGTMGQYLIFSDPEGNMMSAIQLSDWAEVLFADGKLTDFQLQEEKIGLPTTRKLEALLQSRP